MRIRSIKPEFWANEKLSELPEVTHMLAAALLNYADDEGYFNAHPKLIEAALFPLREPSVSVQVMLKQLASIGYLRLGSGDDGRTYGQIVAFTEHQRVNRPTPSKIKPLARFTDDSLSTQGALPNGSLAEQGSGIRDQGKEDPPLPPLAGGNGLGGDGDEGEPPPPKPSPPPKRRRRSKREASEIGARVLERMNELAGSGYEYSPQLEARIAEGVPIEDLLAVVESQWRRDFMRQQPEYFRPKTLFGPENFREYLAQAKAPAQPPPPPPGASAPGWNDFDPRYD